MKANRFDMRIPGYALQALCGLESAGHEAWFVGGCVRDALIGRPVNDYDIATSALWTDAESALVSAGFAVHRTGTKHGTITASANGHALEVTTYRADGIYSDSRHPDDVEFVRTVEEDLARRDFTMNALAFHPERGLLDCWGGKADIEARLIRAVGDPARRFAEDALRILRGCRFASQLGFLLEPDTLAAMKSCKSGLLRVSAERITHELEGLLLGDSVHDALMETVDVLAAILPEVAAMKGFEQHTPYHVYDVLEHTAWVVERSPATRLARWTALLHDIGKPGTFFMDGDRGHFYGHAELSARIGRGILDRLLVAPAMRDRILALVRIHDDEIPATPRGVRRALARMGGDVEMFQTLVGVKRADALAQSDLNRQRLKMADNLELALEEVLAADEAFTLQQLAVDGNDIMALGVAPGPSVGQLLDEALDAVIDGQVPNERIALLAHLEKQNLPKSTH